jgi:serine/threonine protein kinase
VHDGFSVSWVSLVFELFGRDAVYELAHASLEQVRVKQPGLLTKEMVKLWAYQTLSAIARIHESGIIHGAIVLMDLARAEIDRIQDIFCSWRT